MDSIPGRSPAGIFKETSAAPGLKLVPLPPQRIKEFFTYTTSVLKLLPGQTVNHYIPIMEVDFECTGIVRTCSQPFKFRVLASYNHRFWSNDFAHSDALAGPADRPFYFPNPIILPRYSSLTIEICDLSLSRKKRASEASLTFIGYNLRNYPPISYSSL